MTRRYTGTDLTFRIEVKQGTSYITPTSISFQYKYGSTGSWLTATPTAVSTGIYEAVVSPDYGGAIFHRWKTTSPNLSEEGMTYIQPSQFSQYDYPPSTYDYGFVR
jgi:hypothetical protein